MVRLHRHYLSVTECIQLGSDHESIVTIFRQESVGIKTGGRRGKRLNKTVDLINIVNEDES